MWVAYCIRLITNLAIRCATGKTCNVHSKGATAIFFGTLTSSLMWKNSDSGQQICLRQILGYTRLSSSVSRSTPPESKDANNWNTIAFEVRNSKSCWQSIPVADNYGYRRHITNLAVRKNLIQVIQVVLTTLIELNISSTLIKLNYFYRRDLCFLTQITLISMS